MDKRLPKTVQILINIARHNQSVSLFYLCRSILARLTAMGAEDARSIYMHNLARVNLVMAQRAFMGKVEGFRV
jgi:hypothetical protein